MSIRPTSVPSKRLAETINGSATSFKLNNIEGWDGNDLTSADFGTTGYGVFRNSTSTAMELFEFDPSTIASASITITLRGLKFTGDLVTEVSDNKLTWVKGDTIVELGSDTPQLLNNYVDLANEQTITGLKTVPTPTAAGHAVNKAYVDDVVGGSATTDQLIVAATAGETVAPGNLLYFDLTDNEWKKTDADTLATVNDVMLGIAQGAGTDGNTISGGVLLRGLDTNQSGMTQGDLMYAGNTAGAIVSSSGTNLRVIGIARTTTNLYFDPDFYTPYMPTSGEKDAMAGGGDLGTPSTSNKFLTEDYLTSDAFDFGDGVDGDVTISGATTLTRDMYYNNLTVNNVLSTDGYRIFVKGTLSGTGTIKGVTGNAGAVDVGGASSGGGTFKTTAGGAAGNVAGSAGSAGGAGNLGLAGRAGESGAGAGGAGGSVIPSFGNLVGSFAFPTFYGLTITSSLTFDYLKSAGGGGGGGGTSGSPRDAGGGGASGGLVLIVANIWSGTFTIQSLGGAGGASLGGNSGDGAGGNGGCSIVVYKTKTWTGSYALTGGAGGGNYAAGIGVSGTSYEVQIGNLL